jgi:ribose transport system substrate-binding protein
MKSLDNEFFQNMVKSAQYYHSLNATQFDLDIAGIPNETDIAGQIALVDRAISEHVDAIILAPADSTALVPVVRKAIDAGIDVVNIDNRLDQAALRKAHLKVVYVGPDNREAARQVGEMVAGRLAKGDAVAIIEGVPTAFNGAERTAGLRQAMTQVGIRVVDSRPGLWETAPAEAAATAILKAHPEVKALLCDNDDMALGALTAIHKAGLDGKVLVSGFDNIPSIQPYMRNHAVIATVDQFGDQVAVYGIKRALSDVTGFQQTPVNIVQGN